MMRENKIYMKIIEMLSSIRPVIILISFISVMFLALKNNLNMFDKYKEPTDN